MADFPKIWFLRHGQTVWNAVHRVQGQKESELTELGIRQAQAQAGLLAPILKAEAPPCLVSPLGRAQQTAQIALGGYPYVTDPLLAEAQAGAFEGLTLDEIAEAYPVISAACPQILDLFCEAPGGEGFDTFAGRVRKTLDQLEVPTVIVAHGLWGQILRGIVCGLDRSEMARLPNEQGCVYVLENGAEAVLRAG